MAGDDREKARPASEEAVRSAAIGHLQGSEIISEQMRPALAGALTDTAPDSGTTAPAENPITRFEAQYKALPKGNILAQDSTWETVQARLSDPKNAEKLQKVLELDEPRLYAVMEDGSLEFTDGNPDNPPMFVKDKKTSTLRIILKRDPKQMEAAWVQIDAKTHEWASVREMLDWAAKNGFKVFEADTKDKRRFGKLMKLAEAASPTGKFVGKPGGPWRETALKDDRYADFLPVDGDVGVSYPNPRYRDVDLGLLRRINI